MASNFTCDVKWRKQKRINFSNPPFWCQH